MNPTDFAATLARGTDELREYAEARMTSRCTVWRKTGGTTTDANGFEVDEWEIVHWDLPFRRSDPRSRGIELAGVRYPEATALDHFAHDADLHDDDHVETTAGEWVGTVERIIKAVKADQATARRCPVVEVSRPTEWG